MTMKHLSLIAFLIIAGCESAANDGSAPAQRQAGTLTEQPVADTDRSRADDPDDEWTLTDHERINQHIIALSGALASEDYKNLDFATVGDPIVMDGDVDLSTVFGDDDILDAEVFTVVDVMPQLLNDPEALSITVTADGVESGTADRVIIQFVVDDEGGVRRPEAIHGKDGACAQIAMLLARQLRFAPGRQQGRPVHVLSSLPFTCTYQ